MKVTVTRERMRTRMRLMRFDHEEDEDDAYHQDDEDGFGEQDDDDEEPESGAYDQEGAEEQEEEEDTRRDQKLRRLQDELADIPFGKLLEVQQTMGTKEFKRIRRGMTIARDGAHGSRRSGDDEVDDADQDEDDDDDDSDSEPESRPTSKVKSAKKAEIAKRGSKHAPAEMSSKKPVSRFRQVVELPKAEQYRDPRFNKLSGKFNDGLFKRSYGFLDDYDKSEIEDLRAAIKKEKDADTREEMERALQRKVSKRISVEKEDKRKAIQREWKKSEAKAVKEGKKPFYLKKGDQEKLALLEKYKELKGGSVDKFLEKRRKKNSSSEKRFLPGSRR
ncbi:hypothetical protein BC830DRAFT_110293 [Chytriomyces sp. MP71]|nr:hypothetical protein BC830DRAFT_110293 [Chytriomyces sp. MP71]